MTADLLKGLGKMDFKLTGFGDEELSKLLEAGADADEASGIAKRLRKVTFYAGDDNKAAKLAMNDRTLVVVFDKESQLEFVKDAIHKRQAGNQKTIGDVIFNVFKRL